VFRLGERGVGRYCPRHVSTRFSLALGLIGSSPRPAYGREPVPYASLVYIPAFNKRDTLDCLTRERVVERYRLKAPTMAVERGSDGQMQLVTISSGTVLQVAGVPHESGLVDVRCDSRIISMFLKDIHDRAEKFLVKGQL